MKEALNKTGRPIFYSICNWGDENSPSWGPEVANSWRTTQDIFDKWASVEYNFMKNSEHQPSARPGGWNDADMFQIGNGGMTIEEEKTHFALWCISKSPLIIGCDLSNIRKESLQILKNTDLIAVN